LRTRASHLVAAFGQTAFEETFMTRRTIKQTKKATAESASGLRAMIDSAEGLLEDLKDQSGAAVESVREKISTTVQMARDRLEDLEVSEVASDAIDGTVGFVKSDPWRAIAIGALAVIAISLVARRGSDY
jgi:ElaB/YqjD/DUF883 family membrane-anchored ribosome-binding protein